MIAVDHPCPGTKDACLVPGASGRFECLDTQAELESCGGCRFGAVGSNSTAVGEDCTITPGAAEGASSCIRGECVAFACQPGWSLSTGAAGRRRSAQRVQLVWDIGFRIL
jgi:hypothetical protein